MNFESMKYDIPETPESFRKALRESVEKELQVTDIRSAKRAGKGYRKVARVAGLVAALGIATSGVAYAANSLYHIYLTNRGAYQTDTVIQSETLSATIPDQVPEVIFNLGYIPEGMRWTADDKLVYSDDTKNGGISLTVELIDPDERLNVITDTDVVESQQQTFGRFEGVYVEYHTLTSGTSFNKRIYLLCPEEYRLVTIYGSEDISKEELIQVAEQLELEQTGVMVDASQLVTLGENRTEGFVASTEETLPVGALPVYQVGDSTTVMTSVESNRIEDLTVTLDSVTLTDTLEGLNPEFMPDSWRDAVNADGTLAQNTLSYIKLGDGVNTLDQVIKTENVNRKLLTITLTYTNNTEYDLNNLLYFGSLINLEQEGNNWVIMDYDNITGQDYDRVTESLPEYLSEMSYCDVLTEDGNYIAQLNEGESVQVTLAWLVNEPDVDKLYLDLTTDGTFSFTEQEQHTGVFRLSN